MVPRLKTRLGIGSRQWADRFVSLIVSTGASIVLVAIALIFLYLVWTVAPIFQPAAVNPLAAITVAPREALLLDVDERGDTALRVARSGVAEFYDLATGAPVAAYDLGGPLRFARKVAPSLDAYAVVDEAGELWVLRTEKVRQAGNPNVIPRLVLRGRVALPDGDGLRGFDAQETTDGVVIALDRGNAVTVQNYRFEAPGLVLQRQQAWRVDHAPARQLLLGARNQWLYRLDSEGRLTVFDLSTPGHQVLFQANVVAPERRVTVSDALLGRYSLLVGDDEGTLTHWSAIRDARGFRMQPMREFDLGKPGVRLLAEPRRKGFVSVDGDGLLNLFYPVIGQSLASYPLGAADNRQLALSPRGDRLLIAHGADTLRLYAIRNAHPELSLTALWSRVWYEGYGEPVFSWQSSSADVDFEPKFSLTPLLFGTLKAAFYALLFAIPLSIMAAIYTAYFMPPELRAWIKPGIETMAALPTVILGFIGGLWLAPLVEANLSSVLSLLLTLPLCLIAVAVLWSVAHRTVSQERERTEWHLLLAVGAVIAAVLLAFLMGPALEQGLYGGNSLRWLREEAGLDYTARNALVVGAMMGLAVIPTIFAIAEDSVHGVPRHLVNGSLALGASRWQTLTRVVLLTAGPGIFSAVMVGVGRAVGETMIVLMATGNTPIMEFNLFTGLRTFAANIAVEMPESEVGGSHYRILFLMALVLFVLTFLFNTVAELVRERLREHYGRL